MQGSSFSPRKPLASLMPTYHRQILALSDEELERFVFEWLAQKADAYHEVMRYSGAGDLGRDVVGFYSSARHEGEWDNYQCKQLSSRLSTESGLREIGKILYNTSLGHFTPPVHYFFVAPKGVNRNFQALIDKPAVFRDKMIEEWPRCCAEQISEGEHIPMEGELLECIQSFDFSKVHRIGVDEMLLDPHIHPVLLRWFGVDPGPAPRGSVPAEVQSAELPYVQQLLTAYALRDAVEYSDHTQIAQHPTHGTHFVRQRERFYHAAAFKTFYRDNTDPTVLEHLEDDIYHGVVETWQGEHRDPLHCVDAVMSQAANVSVSGPLAGHTSVPVKQGVCHHFANEDRIRWCP